MIHAKFHNNLSSCFVEDFLKDFTIFEHSTHLGHVTWIIYIKTWCSTLNMTLIDQLLTERKAFETKVHVHLLNPGAGTGNARQATPWDQHFLFVF